ncbi:Mfa1 family fimbria major subunit [Phocaeicola sp.]
MKIKSLVVGMMACAALVACSNEDLVEGGNGDGTDGGTTAKAYVAISIADPTNGISRATGDFENGEETERTISNALFVFYKDGNLKQAVPYNQPIAIDHTNTNGENVEAVSKAVIALNSNNEDMPNQVIAYLNILDNEAVKNALANAATITDAMAVAGKAANEIADYATSGKFIMTNSVYAEGENVQCAAPVTNENFAQTKADALKSSVQIYVERIAAKVGMTQKSNVEIPAISAKLDGNTDVELRLTIDGWGLNGLNKNAYLLKNIDATWNFGSWNWNDYGNKRSYWAKDANYDNGNYPTSYEDYNPSNSSLTYISWNEIDKNNKEPQYCLENTMNAALATKEQINKQTYMLIIGHYDLYENNKKVEGITELYKYATIFYKADKLKALLANKYESAGGIYIKKTEGSKDTYTPAEITSFSIERASLSEAKLVFNGNAATTYYKKTGDETYEAYESIDAINAAILAQLGTATAYRDGIKTFFYTQIEHLNTDATKDGHIGIVRNHVYKLTLNKIENLGEGVYNPDEEIIITNKDKEFYVGATLNILSWKVVDQEVNL